MRTRPVRNKSTAIWISAGIIGAEETVKLADIMLSKKTSMCD